MEMEAEGPGLIQPGEGLTRGAPLVPVRGYWGHGTGHFLVGHGGTVRDKKGEGWLYECPSIRRPGKWQHRLPRGDHAGSHLL